MIVVSDPDPDVFAKIMTVMAVGVLLFMSGMASMLDADLT